MAYLRPALAFEFVRKLALNLLAVGPILTRTGSGSEHTRQIVGLLHVTLAVNQGFACTDRMMSTAYL